MEDNKDLGKLFKERLANTEAEPSSALWSQIEKTLDEKPKRRGYIWFWVGIILVLSLSSIIYFSTKNSNSSELEYPLQTPTRVTEIQKKNKLQKNDVFDKETTDNANKSNQDDTVGNPSNQNTVDLSNQPANNTSTKPATTVKKNIAKNNTPINQVKSTKNLAKQKSHLKEDKEFSQLANNSKEKTNQTSKNENNTSSRESNSRDSKNGDDNNIGNVAIKEEEQLLTDSIPKETLKTKKTISKEKKKPKKKKDDSKKWLITAYGGPNLYHNLTTTLPFDDNLTNRQLNPGISYTYGILMNIPIDEKFTFRLGYRKSNLKLYANNAVHNTIPGSTDYLSIVNSNTIRRDGIPTPTILEETLSPPNAFNIEQNINYYAFPLELLYVIKNGKLKLEAIAGLSIMTLGNNNILLETQAGRFNIGGAAYLKKSHLSSGLGVGLRYQIFEGISIDIEPLLQYQFKAFEKGFKNGNPIIFSINAGTTIRL